MKRMLWLISVLVLGNFSLQGFAPINFFAPDDSIYQIMAWENRAALNHCCNFGVNIEYGETRSGRNWDRERKNILQLYDATQATIPMLMGQGPNHPATELLHDLDAVCPGQLDDDGILGHISLCSAEFTGLDVTLQGRYRLPISAEYGHFSLFAALPIRSFEVSGIGFSADRRSGNPMDPIVYDRLSSPDNLSALLKELCGPSLSRWSKTGLGDLFLQLGWQMSFYQTRDYLKRVDIMLRAGVTAPTSDYRDEDQAFSISLGNDGAWGFPFGGGLTLNFINCMRSGLNVDFLVLLDETHDRRIKTEIHQTEFLLLKKAKVTKDHGLVWRFNLWAQAYHFFSGLSLKVAYQYLKRDGDTLTPHCNDVSCLIMNTARSLEEDNVHHFIFSATYDACPQRRNLKARPHINFFVKLPFAGKGIIDPMTIGGQFAVSF